jgi:hypothetical protein
MELHQARYFVAVCNDLNFTRGRKMQRLTAVAYARDSSA